MKTKAYLIIGVLIMFNSCANTGRPNRPLPRTYKSRMDLRLYRETSRQQTTYWIDSSEWHFLPGNSRCLQVALIPHGRSIDVIRVWSPIEFNPPGDFKMRFKIATNEINQLETEVWITADKFNQYFSIL
jgi:hypothetical protein